MATFQEAAQQAYQQAQQFLNNGGYAAEPGEDVSQIVQQFAIKNLADQYGAEFVSNNLQQFAPYIPGLNVEAAQQQIGNLVRLGQAQSGGPFGINELQPVDQFLERTGVPLAIGIGGAYIGAGSGGLLGDAAGSGVTAADVGGGMLPEYGTTGAYNAGIGAGGTITGGTGDAALIGNPANDVIPSSNAGVGVEGGTTGTQAASTDLGGGLSVDQYGNVTGGQFAGGPGTAGGTDFAALGTDPVTGAAVAGTASGVTGGTVGSTVGTGATAAGTSTALSRVLDGTGTTADLISVLGTAGITGLSVAGANDQANTLHDIYADMTAKRQPYLDTANSWLADPNAYINGPGQAALSGVLRGLSVNGNPMGSGTSLELATEAGMRNWQNAVTGMANLGLSGEDTRAQVATNAANAGGAVYSDIGRGIANLTSPPSSLDQLLRSLRGSGVSMPSLT
jgi:hypothetical protein